jgi:hypothetical protein
VLDGEPGDRGARDDDTTVSPAGDRALAGQVVETVAPAPWAGQRIARDEVGQPVGDAVQRVDEAGTAEAVGTTHSPTEPPGPAVLEVDDVRTEGAEGGDDPDGAEGVALGSHGDGVPGDAGRTGSRGSGGDRADDVAVVPAGDQADGDVDRVVRGTADVLGQELHDPHGHSSPRGGRRTGAPRDSTPTASANRSHNGR